MVCGRYVCCVPGTNSPTKTPSHSPPLWQFRGEFKRPQSDLGVGRRLLTDRLFNHCSRDFLEEPGVWLSLMPEVSVLSHITQ